MQEFIAKHQDKIAGTLSGFDRLVFRGHLRSIGNPQGMMNYLWTNQVFLKDFGGHVEKITERLKEASLAEARACRRPVQYLNSSQLNKETIARNILAQDGVRSGLVCVLSCIEPCWKFEIHRNRITKKLELKLGPGKCLFLYHYQVHPVFGFLNASHSNLVPFLRANLYERARMAGATDARGWSGVPAAGQLLPLDCRLGESSALNGSSA